MIRTAALGETSEVRHREWSASDTMLYALAVGAGAEDLALTTENTVGVDLVALPSFAAVLAGGAGDLKQKLGEWAPSKTVHGTQLLVFGEPIEPAGSIDVVASVSAIEDKGSGALIEVDSRAVDAETGRTLFTSTTGLFIRGEGGFDDGGSRAKGLPSGPLPEGPADLVVSSRTSPDQALLYRLCGDRNPLHSDPAFARRAGFDRPILHGLCTWGFALRMLGCEALGGAFERVRSFGGRFRATVLPGDELTVEGWWQTPEEISFIVRVGDVVVIDSGMLEVAS